MQAYVEYFEQYMNIQNVTKEVSDEMIVRDIKK